MAIQSIERAAAILRALAGGSRRLGVSEIADRLGLAKGTVHGLLQTLRDLGITLLSLIPLPADEAVEPPNHSPNHTHHHAPGATS